MANTKDVGTAVSEILGVSKKEGIAAVEAVFQVITGLQVSEDVSIAGYGKFGVKEKSARVAKNPKTGETVNVAAKTAPTFKAAKNLKDTVNV